VVDAANRLYLLDVLLQLLEHLNCACNPKVKLAQTV
jgi:hypothetical protein